MRVLALTVDSTSPIDLPARNLVAPKFMGAGPGMTSEQSTIASMSWPRVAMAVKMNWKSAWSLVWLSVKCIRSIRGPVTDADEE